MNGGGRNPWQVLLSPDDDVFPGVELLGEHLYLTKLVFAIERKGKCMSIRPLLFASDFPSMLDCRRVPRASPFAGFLLVMYQWKIDENRAFADLCAKVRRVFRDLPRQKIQATFFQNAAKKLSDEAPKLWCPAGPQDCQLWGFWGF